MVAASPAFFHRIKISTCSSMTSLCEKASVLVLLQAAILFLRRHHRQHLK
jgi:hypothetical protein